ncbi:MAG: DUF6164 family protein [Mariprofundaceae bacterium]|nr:DUF6164 family protein [Mariprofundaceae bacterium]
MPELLFRLRNVPDDEAEEVRQLLNDHKIDFYETHAGGWGISMPGIWLPDNQQLKEAKSLLEHYQHERTKRMRSLYEELKREGRHQTAADRIMDNPVRFILLVIALLFILYISLSPFLEFGK